MKGRFRVGRPTGLGPVSEFDHRDVHEQGLCTLDAFLKL